MKTIKDWYRRLFATRRRRVLVGILVAMPAMALGSWLIAEFIASRPPDPMHDQPDRVIAFFMGRHFDRLSPARRDQYLQAVAERYPSFTTEQREQANAMLGQYRQADRQQFRQRMEAMWRTLLIAEANRYLALPADEREAWLAQRLAAWYAIANGPPQRGYQNPDNHPFRRELTETRQTRMVEFFQQRVLPHTDAPQRAALLLMFRDLGQHMQRQRADQ